jgi:hypothetical protein
VGSSNAGERRYGVGNPARRPDNESRGNQELSPLRNSGAFAPSRFNKLKSDARVRTWLTGLAARVFPSAAWPPMSTKREPVTKEPRKWAARGVQRTCHGAADPKRLTLLEGTSAAASGACFAAAKALRKITVALKSIPPRVQACVLPGGARVWHVRSCIRETKAFAR